MDTQIISKLHDLVEAEYQGDADALLRDIASALSAHGVAQEESKAKAEHRRKTAKPIIELHNVHRDYEVGKSTVHALKSTDLTIYEGEIVALVGPSGSGKTTLLNLIGGLDQPNAGTVTVKGTALHDMKERQRATYRNQTIGFIFQFFHLQPYLNVLQNTEIPLMIRGQEKHDRHEAAAKALQAVGLEEKLLSTPSQLSGGQMQRVAIARALINDPSIILADEPTGNLDRENAKDVMERLLQINTDQGTTLIIVTHDQFVAGFAQRVITLSDGNIQSDRLV